MAWTIEINYMTGNSFGSSEDTGSVEITWENLDVAKAALARISALDKYDRAMNTIRWRSDEAAPERPVGYCEEYPDVCIMLPLDDGREQQFSTFWRGYFERLIEANIVAQTPDASDMRYRP